MHPLTPSLSPSEGERVPKGRVREKFNGSMRENLFGRILFLIILALLTLDCLAREVMPPKPASYFNDYAGVVSTTTAQRLNQTLEDFEKSTSSQIVVAVFPRMQTDSALEDYTRRIAETWKVGQQGKNNGAVLFVFVQERRMRIEVGYGLEGALPDALGKRIVDDEIAPHFKRGDYDGGLTAGVTALLQAARGEYKGTGRTVNQRGNPGGFIFILFWLIVLILIVGSIRRMARGTVYHRSGRVNYGGWWWGGGGWGGGGGGGWGGGGGSSGGGFSGGGGSFGGGGASGSW